MPWRDELSWLEAVRGLEAKAVAVAPDAQAAAVLTADRTVWVQATGEQIELAGGLFMAFEASGQLWLGDEGKIRRYDRAGIEVASVPRSGRYIVRRGALVDGSLILVGKGYQRVSGRRVHWTVSPGGFMSADNDAVVDPEGRWLVVAGSEGMDAGWSTQYALSDGSEIEAGAVGYAIDAIDFLGERVVFIDEQLGLTGHEGVQGNALWQTSRHLFVQQRHGVLRLTGDTMEHWELVWPAGLCASTHGDVVGVVSEGAARFATTRDQRWRSTSS